MCRNQEILPVSASLFLRYLLFSKLLSLWDTLQINNGLRATGRNCASIVRVSGALITLVVLSGCETSSPTHASKVMQAKPVGREGAKQRHPGEVWDGRGATKVEFDRVVQSNPVTVEGRRSAWGILGGSLAGATVPNRASTGGILVSAVGTVTGAVIGTKV
ncbi:MAG: hypothetical protein J6386_14015 [Candidatus Synoicihabitans palmerolidicus]|nr:hypothetical protein [Candidatus Synoicihabitans palmerolidicus]